LLFLRAFFLRDFFAIRFLTCLAERLVRRGWCAADHFDTSVAEIPTGRVGPYDQPMPKARRAKSRADLPFALRLAVTNAWVSQLFDEEMSKKGVAPFQAGVLMMVRMHEPVTPTGLEAVMGLAGTTLRDRIRDLTRAGLVERVPNAKDGRSYFLQTTSAGAALARTAIATTRRVTALLERHTGPLDGLRDPLDAVRAAARELLEGELRPGSGSRSIGPW
jgi:DNA-binding MarR family transcriptional regulator